MNHRNMKSLVPERSREELAGDDRLVSALRKLTSDPHAQISDAHVSAELDRLHLVRPVRAARVVTPRGAEILERLDEQQNRARRGKRSLRSA